MSKRDDEGPLDAREEFRRRVESKAARKVRAQGREIWLGLTSFGAIGWSVAVPTLGCVALGLWLDRRFRGPLPWTLLLLVAGIGLGCLNAWYWLQHTHKGE